MDLMELILIFLGAAVFVYYGGKLLLFSRMLFPKRWFPLSKTFFTSMGEWAVVTGASEGIGRAYAFALAERGMNVVIMSRTKATLDQVAKEIVEATGQDVKVIVTDFSSDNIYGEIEGQLEGLNIGVLVNNIGVLPNAIPCKFLDTEKLEKTITNVINCNVKTVMKMCKIVLPDMEKRFSTNVFFVRVEKKGVIINISSGISSTPFPLYSLYAASKVFVERFSRGLQAEYESKGILIQAVVPFGVSTRMACYQKTNVVTLSPEDFVENSLQYLGAGDTTYGSISHIVLGWFLRSIPLKMLHSELALQGLQNHVRKKMKQMEVASEGRVMSENGKHENRNEIKR